MKLKLDFFNIVFKNIILNIIKNYNSDISINNNDYDIILTDHDINNEDTKCLFITCKKSNIKNKRILSLFNHLYILDISETDLNKNDTIFYYFSNLIYNFILENYPSFANTCIVLDPIRSLEYIIDTKKSLSRFGDGEINMAKGYDIHYEKHDKFTEIFIEILKNNNDNCYVGLCDIFYKSSFKYWKIHEKNYWNKISWINNYQLFCPKNIIYLSAQISRPNHYAYEHDDNLPLFNYFNYITLKQQIFINKRILCIQNFDYLSNFYINILYPAYKIDYFIIKSSNASIDMNQIINYVMKNNYELILLFAGPMASHLSYLFSSNNIQSIDMGQCNYPSITNNKEEFLQYVLNINNLLNLYNVRILQPQIFNDFSYININLNTQILNKNITWTINNLILKEEHSKLTSILLHFESTENLKLLNIVNCIFKLESSDEYFRLYNGLEWLELENNKQYEIPFNFNVRCGVSFSIEKLNKFITSTSLQNKEQYIKMDIYDVLLKIIK